MFDFLKRLVRQVEPEPGSPAKEEKDRHYKAKKAGMERLLGPMVGFAGGAAIPFEQGGMIDLYYFPECIPGTVFATMDLIRPDGSGPKPNETGTYELVTYTKQPMPEPGSGWESDESHPFSLIATRFARTFTEIAHYARGNVLKPWETCEVPGEVEEEPYRCVLFDHFNLGGGDFMIAGKKHGLLVCIEIFRSEMVHAMENGTASLLQKLMDGHHYPYSDLDRAPVV